MDKCFKYLKWIIIDIAICICIEWKNICVHCVLVLLEVLKWNEWTLGSGSMRSGLNKQTSDGPTSMSYCPQQPPLLVFTQPSSSSHSLSPQWKLYCLIPWLHITTVNNNITTLCVMRWWVFLWLTDSLPLWVCIFKASGLHCCHFLLSGKQNDFLLE